MNKIYTLFLFLIIGSSVVIAQNSATKKADELYQKLKYVDAAEAYQKLIKNGDSSPYVYEQLGNTYYFINDTKNAETFYGKVVKEKNVAAETVYNYAQSLKANGKVSEYNTWMQNFAKMKPADSRAVDFMKNPNYLPQIMDENRERYTVSKMNGVNSKYSDFGGTMVGNDVYFASSRNSGGKKYGWNEEPFLDIYKMSVDGNSSEPKNVGGEVNTKYHESSPVISADGKRMYFDRNDYYKGKYKKSEEGISQINLYYADNVNGEWKDVKTVPFNNSEYSTGHPALSPDGNILYFTSDKPGGKGKSDIYKVSVDKNGGFGTPVRLGDNINTEGKEVFPSVDSNGTLYFSSDGQLGLGGLDVFYAEASGNDFGTVKNMGGKVNSTDDDFAFFMNTNTGEGFVSSNRKGGMGSDDIYKVVESKVCEIEYIVQVIDEDTNEPIAGVTVDLYDNSENKLRTKISDNNGNVTFIVACNQPHVVQAQGQPNKYEGNEIPVAEISQKGVLNIKVPLKAYHIDPETDLKIDLQPILFDFDRYNIKPQAAVILQKLIGLMKVYPEMVIKVEGHTDTRGSDAYNRELSDKRARTIVQYVISKGIDASRISGEGFGENRPVVSCGENCTEEQHQENRRSEFIIVKK